MFPEVHAPTGTQHAISERPYVPREREREMSLILDRNSQNEPEQEHFVVYIEENIVKKKPDQRRPMQVHLTPVEMTHCNKCVKSRIPPKKARNVRKRFVLESSSSRYEQQSQMQLGYRDHPDDAEIGEGASSMPMRENLRHK